MTTTKQTTVDLLDAVNGAKVWRNPDGTSVLYLRNVWGMKTPFLDVTEEIAALERAGLVHVFDLAHQRGLWWITDKGGRVLHPRPIDRLLSLFRR